MPFTSWFSSTMTILKVGFFPYFLKNINFLYDFRTCINKHFTKKTSIFSDSLTVDRQLEDKVEIKDEVDMEDQESVYDEIIQIMEKL